MVKREGFALLYISIGCFFLMSACILLMHVNFIALGMKIVGQIVGIAFWITLIAGIVTQVILERIRLKWFKRNRIRENRNKIKCGAISFMQNVPACVADGAFVVSLFCLVISGIATKATGYICYVFTALLVFSFCMHCIFNGKIYYFLKNQGKILKNTKNKHLGK